ncbi:shikimate kinase [Melghiribacillus thermohalophilus]|uniref:Shikimate kinase n=1 Tax=Melghiribacillus thermohalophilus TaxID=1324956 RepID=A0A4V2V2Y0_9BACI|nr:shikimate kinase [Melghiribacillus thermohalophilus]TCT26951.1 shikimate kinase [Melghiribacillus thermohalophilus]
MKGISLIGFMGSGKTSVGEELANALQLAFLDTDHQIEIQCGKSIPELFSSKGEKIFRDYETMVLKQMPTFDVVVSTGGGIVERRENRKWLKEHYQVIFLNTDLEVIRKRLADDRSRPLWQKGKDEVEQLFQRRFQLYRTTAHRVIDTNNRDVRMVVEEILSGIN